MKVADMLTTALEVAGFLLFCSAAVVLFGLAGALASAGAACLLASWLLERRA